MRRRKAGTAAKPRQSQITATKQSRFAARLRRGTAFFFAGWDGSGTDRQHELHEMPFGVGVNGILCINRSGAGPGTAGERPPAPGFLFCGLEKYVIMMGVQRGKPEWKKV
jgi:hypothetical protein